MRFLISAITRLIEAWGKLGWFSQLMLVLFVGIIFVGQTRIIEALKDADWLVKILLGFFLFVVYRIAYWIFSRPYKLDHEKLLEQSKEQMQKNKDLNT